MTVKKHILPVFMVTASFLSFNPCVSQEPILSVDVNEMEEDVYQKERGPNRKHYVNYGYKIGVTWDYETSNGVLKNDIHRSFSIANMVAYKRKLGNIFSWNINSYLGVKNIKLSQSGDISPEFESFFKESIFLYQTGVYTSFRVNYDARRRGDYLGFFTDFGFFCDVNLFSRHKGVDKKAIFKSAKEKVYINNPHYLKRFEFGPEFRIGKHNIMIYVNYRLNRLLTGISLEDLPRFSSGIIFTFE